MPVEKAKVLELIEMMDNFLKQREQDQLDRIDDNEDCDITNPLDAPPSEPFYSDGPPEKIHGQPDQVASPWGEKPKVPIPIEHL
jgi:hypothetical protein